jgi:hypothetical protein
MAATYDIAALKALPVSQPSICIPRVFPNITWHRVKSVFEELGFGDVDKVDMVSKTSPDGKPIKRVFVHFTKWNTDNPDVNHARAQLLAGDFVQVTYDQPWFWRCYKSNIPRPDKPERKDPPKKHVKGTRKPRISIKNKARTDEMKEVMTLKEEIADLKALIQGMTGDIQRPKLVKSKTVARKPKKKIVKPSFTTAPPPKLTIRAPAAPTEPASPAYAPTSPAYAPCSPVEYEPTTPVEHLAPATPPYGGMPGARQDDVPPLIGGTDKVDASLPVYMD